MLLITGCNSTAVYDKVDKTQRKYQMPREFTVEVSIVSDIERLCQSEQAIACTTWVSETRNVVYISEDFYDIEFAAEHEFNHIVYGPKHKGE